MLNLETLSHSFGRFARRECDSATLYRQLSLDIARDETLLELASHGDHGPRPNLFLSAVHYLLLGGESHPLARFYPSITANAASPEGAFEDFRGFCLDHPHEIADLMRTRLVQTNEVRRAAILLPAFQLILGREPGRALTLIEIGASAGFLLLPDRYGYGPYGSFEDHDSGLQITCTVRGDVPPPLVPRRLSIAQRVGIDLHPVDVTLTDEALWLQALVWPDQTQRMRRVRDAIAILSQEPPELVAGDAVHTLPRVLTAADPDAIACVFHCHTLNQFPVEARQAVDRTLENLSDQRRIYRISLEAIQDNSSPRMLLTTYEGGQVTSEEHLANYQAHGEWIEWLASPG